MYYFRYPLADGGPDDFLPVATTRPETILGDNPLANHHTPAEQDLPKPKCYYMGITPTGCACKRHCLVLHLVRLPG